MKLIDAHIHLEMYEPVEQEQLLAGLHESGVDGLIAVSMHLDSCKRTAALADRFPGVVHPAYGFHPEQELPEDREWEQLLAWIRRHADQMVAVGEVGLPYYRRHEAMERGEEVALGGYIDLLEQFVLLAKELNKPIVLHAVHEDAAIACDMLEKYGVTQAHFHWYKGPTETTERMIRNGYMISLTPDVCYEPDIQELARRYPLSLLMAETDGPWPFEGPFAGQPTTPSMLHEVVAKVAEMKSQSVEHTTHQLYRNAVGFYHIHTSKRFG